MLATRIIPTILSKNGQLVKGEGFKCDRVVGNALQAARIHAMRGVDEILVLDVTATKEGREPDYEMVKRLSKDNFSPLTVGGGVKTEEHVRKLLRAGADKVCLGRVLSTNLGMVSRLSDKFGKQCLVASVDVPEAWAYSSLINWVKSLERTGIGEILLQSAHKDGTMSGYDLSLISDIEGVVGIPVIASGGCSGYEDAYNAIKAGASAVAVGALFQFTDKTPKGMAEYLHGKGIEVRV